MAPAKKKRSRSIDLVSEIPSAAPTQTRQKALVFISHDSRNADLAEAFANLLSDVSGGTLKSFRSSDKKGTSGIEFGAEWYTTIMAQLSDATDVVALLTTQSLDRPWILYEAGVAKGKLDTVSFGLALGVPLDRVSTGPFGQFQNCADDEDSLTKLVMQLLTRNPDAEPREQAIRTQVKIFKDRTSKILSASPAGKAGKPEEQNIAKLFEEVKAMVREIPDQIDGRVKFMTRRSGRRGRRYHPRLLNDLLFEGSAQEIGGAAAAFLAAVSIFREDFPWIYELGREVCDAFNSGNSDRFDKARNGFMRALEYIAHSKVSYDILGDEGEMMMLRDSISMFGHFLFDGPMTKLPRATGQKDGRQRVLKLRPVHRTSP